MDRRTALLGLMAAIGGPALAAGCEQNNDAILSAIAEGKRSFFSRKEFRLLGIVADAIIPRTDTPGALDVGVPSYLDAMMKTWASDETKTAQRNTLKAIGERLDAIGGRDVAQLDDAARRDAVAAFDATAYGDAYEDETSAHYRALKQLIAMTYYASEAGATQELQYELVPGRWLADAPLSEIGRTWAE